MTILRQQQRKITTRQNDATKSNDLCSLAFPHSPTTINCTNQFVQLGGHSISKLRMTLSIGEVFHNTFKQHGHIPLNLTHEQSLTSHVTEHNTQHKAAYTSPSACMSVCLVQQYSPVNLDCSQVWQSEKLKINSQCPLSLSQPRVNYFFPMDKQHHLVFFSLRRCDAHAAHLKCLSGEAVWILQSTIGYFGWPLDTSVDQHCLSNVDLSWSTFHLCVSAVYGGYYTDYTGGSREDMPSVLVGTSTFLFCRQRLFPVSYLPIPMGGPPWMTPPPCCPKFGPLRIIS